MSGCLLAAPASAPTTRAPGSPRKRELIDRPARVNGMYCYAMLSTASEGPNPNILGAPALLEPLSRHVSARFEPPGIQAPPGFLASDARGAVIAVANRQFPVSSQMDARRQGRMTTIVVTRRARCRSRRVGAFARRRQGHRHGVPWRLDAGPPIGRHPHRQRGCHLRRVSAD